MAFGTGLVVRGVVRVKGSVGPLTVLLGDELCPRLGVEQKVDPSCDDLMRFIANRAMQMMTSSATPQQRIHSLALDRFCSPLPGSFAELLKAPNPLGGHFDYSWSKEIQEPVEKSWSAVNWWRHFSISIQTQLPIAPSHTSAHSCNWMLDAPRSLSNGLVKTAFSLISRFN